MGTSASTTWLGTPTASSTRRLGWSAPRVGPAATSFWCCATRVGHCVAGSSADVGSAAGRALATADRIFTPAAKPMRCG